MARIEKETRVKGYKYKVIDKFKITKFFPTYRAALAYFLTL